MTVHRPTLESLRIFEACARLGSYARAARDLGLSQSAVASRMRSLEEELGIVLFEQTRQKLKPSAIGKKFATEIGHALALIRTAVERIEGATGNRLRVNVTPAFASRWLAPKLARWDAWPDSIPVELDVGQALPPISTGHCDLAIRVGRGHWPGLSADLLMPVRLTAMLSPALYEALGSPRTAVDLHDVPLLPSDLWPRWFREAGAPFPDGKLPQGPSPTPDALAEAAMAGDGMALLSPDLFRPLLTAARLIAPLAHVISGPDGYYVVRRASHRHARSETFLHWLRHEAEKER